MTRNFQELIQHHRGDTSYPQVAEASGGLIKARALQDIATNGFTRLPSPQTFQGLSVALHISQRDLVLAAARTIGIDIEDEPTNNPAIRPGTPEPAEQIYYWRKHAQHYKARLQAVTDRYRSLGGQHACA